MGKKNAGVLICFEGSKEGILNLIIKMVAARYIKLIDLKKDNK